MKIVRWIISALIVLTMILSVSCKKKVNEPDPQEMTHSDFSPPDGECLFILGQASETYMDAYIDEIRSDPLPAGFAFYTSLSGGAVQSDLPRYKTYLDQYPNTTLQLAIWTGERQWGDPGYYLDEIVAGQYDVNILALASACKSFGKPIFIRFGYEFDGSHNAYPPDKYIAAYRYFVDKMRAQNVTSAVYVWHSWGVDAYYGRDDFPDFYPPLLPGTEVNQELWYPGDDYVDWVALSVFGIGWGDLSTNAVVQYLIRFAEVHDKPVMLAESAAIKTSGVSDPGWVIPNTQWFEHVFDLCYSNDVVKAFTYINVDWEADNPSSTWGDTRIQTAASAVRAYWNLNIPSFLHAGSDLYHIIDYP